MPQRLVVLDGYTLNPGDIDWGPLRELGELRVYDRSAEAQIVPRAAGATCVFTNKTPLSRSTLDQLPAVRYIGVLATGYNIVDVPAATQRGVVVTHVPAYGTDSVAQHAVALMLEAARNIATHDRAVHEGRWTRSPDFSLTVAPITDLAGKTLGVVGLGRIGQAVARIAAAMGMRIMAPAPGDGQPRPPIDGLPGVVTAASLDELFTQADVVTLHCPLTADNKHMVNARRLALMKPGAILINTSRGGLVDQHALAEALRAGRIAGAALDVLDPEPPPTDNPLLGAPRCVITPHVAWAGQDTRRKLMAIAADNLRAFQQGRAVNVVRPVP